MFFDKSDRCLYQNEILSKGSSAFDHTPTQSPKLTTAFSAKHSVGAPPLPKPRKKSLGSALGPGCYFHETSLVKPSFNKLATDSSLQKPSALNGESFAETRHGSVRSLINCSFGPTGPIQRSTLLERRDIKSTLRDLIQRNASLETLIKTQEQILLENIREQTELSEERFVKARGKQPKQTLQASDDFPSTPNLSEFEEECGDIDDFYNYYNSK